MCNVVSDEGVLNTNMTLNVHMTSKAALVRGVVFVSPYRYFLNKTIFKIAKIHSIACILSFTNEIKE